MIDNIWPRGQVHLNDNLLSKAFGEWIDFTHLHTFIAANDYREYIINLKDKFSVDLNLIIDPLKMMA